MSGGQQAWEWDNGNHVGIDVDGANGKTVVNGKPGFFVNKGELGCYGIVGKPTELSCTSELTITSDPSVGAKVESAIDATAIKSVAAKSAATTASDAASQEQEKAKTPAPTLDMRNESIGLGTILLAGFGGAVIAILIFLGVRRVGQSASSSQRVLSHTPSATKPPNETTQNEHSHPGVIFAAASSTIAQNQSQIDNTFVWLLVAVPVIGSVIENFLDGNSPLSNYSLFCYVITNTILCVVDDRRLRAGSIRKPNVWAYFVVPAYLWLRASRLKHPPYYFWAWMLTFIASIYVYSANIGGAVPNCDSKEVVALAEKAIRDAPLIKLSGFQIKGISMPAERRYDARNESRLCRAMLSHALGEEAMQYTVEWHDKKKRTIWVQMVNP